MTSHESPIGVVVVSYNTAALLPSCLEPLRRCALPLEIVVVDNASPQGSPDFIREQLPEATLINLSCNLGFAGGTNVGLNYLLGWPQTADDLPPLPERTGPPPNYVLLLNPDTVASNGAAEALAAFLDAHPRVGMVGPRLLNQDGTLQPAAFRFPTVMMTLLDVFPPGEVLPGRLYNSWQHGRYPQEAGNEPFPIDHPLGACMLVRREVIEQVGVLDEGYFMYAEEVDWCKRIRGAGWAIWQEPRARVTHIGGASTSQFRGPMLVALYESRLHYLRRHGAPVAVHRTIIAFGFVRLSLLAWWGWLRGTIDLGELRGRLWSYGKILGL